VASRYRGALRGCNRSGAEFVNGGSAMKIRGSGRTLAAGVLTLLMGACATRGSSSVEGQLVEAQDARAPNAWVAETIYVQLDGIGLTPPDEFRPPERERYLESIAAGLREAETFAATEIWSEDVPDDAVIVDAHVNASIDEGRSWSKAAWLLVVPVRTVGDVQVTFELKRGERTLESRRYQREVVTYAVPVAELGGRTWIEKSGILPRIAQQFGDDLEISALRNGRPLAVAAR
jgi:hypothetical protein